MSRERGVPEGHVLGSFLEEHRRMRRFLDHLEDALSRGAPPQEARLLLEELEFAARHDALEEDVLFPLLRGKGVRDGPNLFDAEHGHLRNLRARLRTELARWAGGTPGDPVAWEQLERHATRFVERCREHLQHEEATVYLAALELVDDEELWTLVERGRQALDSGSRRT